MSASQSLSNGGSIQQLGGDSEWWRSAVVYQIYPRSYLDTNADGVGDLAGICDKLDYLHWLGVDAIWISPFFTSPMKDFGYDVSDYKGIDPLFGTHQDFKLLMEKAHRLGIRVLIDLVLSHTADVHDWFKESRQSRDNAKADWYVWADPKVDGTPPNNWLSIFGGSAWEWDAVRRQYYLHNFLTSQPDLNFHNVEVQDAVLDVTRFWLDLGVDGFRLDTANMYFHDAELRDNPPIGDKTVNGIDPVNPYAMQEPKYNISRPETPAFMERFRAVLDEYPAVTSVGELGAVVDMYETLATYTEEGQRLHMGYSFDFMTKDYSAAHIRSVVEKMQQNIGSGWPCWAFSNHDVERVVSRWGVEPKAATMLTALSTCLKGTACLYQGEELGLPEAEVAFEDLQDPFGIRFWPGYKGRDGCRTPMPWQSDDKRAGFTGAERGWLPVAPDHLPLAVSEQQSADDSILKRTRHFLHWRKQHSALLSGDIRFLDAPEGMLAFVREDAQEKLLCVFQLDGKASRFESGFEQLESLESEFFGSDCSEGICSLPAYGMFFGSIQD